MCGSAIRRRRRCCRGCVSDLLPSLVAACEGNLAGAAPALSDVCSVAVVMAARGYPGPATRGARIHGFAHAAGLPHVAVFHAATERQGDDIVAAGGRVLTICATGTDVASARSSAYAGVRAIAWQDAVFRSDIGAEPAMSVHGDAKPITVPDLRRMKGGVPQVWLTAYTTPMAQRLDPVCDVLLVGDSLGMVLYGLPSTLSVTLDMMIAHGAAVVRGARRACVLVDLPFGTYQASPEQAFAASGARIGGDRLLGRQA